MNKNEIQYVEHINNKKFKDRTGLQINNWVFLGYAGDYKWWCECQCVNKTIKKISSKDVVTNKNKSCGCLPNKRSTIHNLSKSLVRNSYRAAKERYENINHKNYKEYGDRGIKFLYTSLLDMIKDIGMRPGKEYSIERIDNNGNYEPGNCKWALMEEQGKNRRGNIWITYEKESKLLKEWSICKNISMNTLHSRLNKLKWCVECSLTIPTGKGKCSHIK